MILMMTKIMLCLCYVMLFKFEKKYILSLNNKYIQYFMCGGIELYGQV